jgi:signal transduction histidine kinase
VLSGSADTLARHWQDMSDDDRAELFDAMTSSAGRMSRLLTDLLTASRLESTNLDLRLRPVGLRTLVTEAVMAARRARPGVDVTFDCPDDISLVADPDRLAQALDNLLDNAVRHGAPPVHVAVRARGIMAEISVTDAGQGVAAQLLPRLFQRFATGAREGGTGLGLFIVRELARAHGGDAWYASGAGEPAARFVLAVPRDPAAGTA